MGRLALAFWACSLSISLPHLFAEDSPKNATSRNVGSIDGKEITAADIELSKPINVKTSFDARDTEMWEQMGRISNAFGKPIMERFVKQHKIEATADEIEKFKINSRKMKERSVREFEAKIEELKESLADPNLSDEDQARMRKEKAMYEGLIPGMREPDPDKAMEQIARPMILAWKTERELHRQFGGRVIFQQFGPEALDARRKLYEQAEKNGDLKFNDEGVRHLFYYYSNMKHIAVDEKLLEKPWFLSDAN